ncbi:hypothetical protein N7517_010683 [Penicillium concentricum]|uniref:Uncharacterized protein n=1 Tax=Penicillium concentricum TaxID=293559 RepID=A0A9W9RBZ2_9EURO|nr:uncharacterized protein N7517_010683 [Penicillium concentricum]KAJ5356074.1 hypothetical protein N7517_010683 [Penicillium concentricum]
MKPQTYHFYGYSILKPMFISLKKHGFKTLERGWDTSWDMKVTTYNNIVEEHSIEVGLAGLVGSINIDEAKLFYNTEEGTLEERLDTLKEGQVKYLELPLSQPNTPSLTPSPLVDEGGSDRGRDIIRYTTPLLNPARLDPLEVLRPTQIPDTSNIRRSPRSTKGRSPERYHDLKWKKYGEPDRDRGAQCAMVGLVISGGSQCIIEGLVGNSPFRVGFAMSSTEIGPK